MRDGRRIDVDVAVIGAGPAGLGAAIAAASHGRSVAVFDESPAPGGRLPGQLHQGQDGAWHEGRSDAERLYAAALAAGVAVHLRTAVWGLEPEWELFLNPAAGGPRSASARTVVLATGAGELAAPVPGWTLPGVFTPGGMQTMVNVHGVLPGRRVAVAGLNPLGFEVAQLLEVLGAEVIGVQAPAPAGLREPVTPGRALTDIVRTVGDAAPSRVLRAGGRLARYGPAASVAARLVPPRVAGIPLRLDEALVELRGDGRVEEAVIAPLERDGTVRDGGHRSEPIDAACLGNGLRPLVELTGSTGCEVVDLPGLSGPVPLHGRSQQTTRIGLYLAGGASGVEGAAVCERQGTVAGLAAARACGSTSVTDRDLDAARRAVTQARQDAPVRFHPDVVAGRRAMQRRWEQRCTTT